jgi:hypothetical protein
VETPSGKVDKKAHTCHLHLPNAYFELACDLNAHLEGRYLQLLQSKNGFYAILTAQADADSNQQTAGPKVSHTTHSATRLGVYL